MSVRLSSDSRLKQPFFFVMNFTQLRGGDQD